MQICTRKDKNWEPYWHIDDDLEKSESDSDSDDETESDTDNDEYDKQFDESILIVIKA